MKHARQSTCVAISGRGLLIEGPAGSGKSSLALALIDRGARLVGDDGVLLECQGHTLTACPHPNTRGLIEVRNLGLVPMACVESVVVCLLIVLDDAAPRYIDEPDYIDLLGASVPSVMLAPQASTLHIKAELALARYGIAT